MHPERSTDSSKELSVTLKIAVVGNGYVGTVVAACFARVGHLVVGLEADAAKLAQLRQGRAPFFEAGLDDLLADGLRRGHLRFSADPVEAVGDSDLVFLCVGTPPGADGRPDMVATQEAATAVGAALRRHHVVVTKSTVPIGSGRWLSSIVEDALSAHGAAEASFSVVSNPEFLRQGSAITDFLHPDRVVIGSDDSRALDVVAQAYAPIVDQAFPGSNGRRPPLVRTNLATAETIKYASNAFLATKISFINELANICEKVGADVTELVTAMGLDARIGGRHLDPGVGWGGSCFGKDLAALVATAEEYGYEASILEAAVAVNARQRTRVVEKLQVHLKSLRGRRLGILGLAFKPGTDDLRDAPALDIISRLLASGALVTAHDPVVKHLPGRDGVRLVETPEAVADRADAIILVTEWPEYLGLDLGELHSRMRGDVLIDGRNLFDPARAAEAGLVYEGFGRSLVRQRADVSS
jgi:nucleotide sugar dehydrogenase